MKKTIRLWCFAGALVLLIGTLNSKAEEAPCVVFDAGRSRICLDITDQQVDTLSLRPAIADFAACFERMTGQSLPQSGGTVALFDPTMPDATRFECVVVSLEDKSPSRSANVQVGIVLSPRVVFRNQPFAEPGEKVAWTATWQRRDNSMVFTLAAANQPNYGPGYGPFRFAEIKVPAPVVDSAAPLLLALEMRGGSQPGLRGGYAFGKRAWQYTKWFDPASAGTDRQAPGKSEDRGSQAWHADWQKNWSGNTAFFVTAYAPKGRQAAVTVSEAQVRRAGQSLYHHDFSKPTSGSANKTAAWAHLPQTGTVQENIGSARLEPKTGGWNTVGLRANWIRGQSNSKLLPVRVKLLDFPAGVSRFDAGLVQGFEMEVGDEQIQLRAHTPLGLSNAIYYMLDYWGCRWVMPGKLGECIPKKDSLTLPSGATRFAPRADLAIEVAGRQGNVAEWYRRNLGGWQNWISGQHYWLYALPPKQHFADHPEWYALVAGKRSPKQLCTTNPEVVEQMIVKAKSFLRAAPTRVSFPMDPADNIDFCQCERCRALDPKTTDPGGAVCVTNRVLTFANQVAKGIQDEFPDRYVAFYAYATHANLPDNIRPADNVIIIAARSGHCLLHLTPTPKCPTSDFHAFVKRWRELTPNIYCYEYDPISWTGGLPCPTYLEMARSLQALFLEVGIKGSYSDGLHAQTSASTYINRYMARRMKIDPTQRPEDVLREMCQAFFGPAARPMEQYYLRLARVAEHTHAGRSRVGGGTTFYAGLFDRDMLRDARRHMDQAKTQVNNSDPYRERVEMVGASLRYLEAYTNGTWRAQEHDYQASVAAFDRMDRIIDELDAKGMIYAAEARQRAKTKRLKALAQHFPKKLGFVTKWRLLGPFDNTSCNADRVQDVFEPLASIDGPVTLPDGRRMQWQDYTSPGGFLNLENAFKGQVGDWILSYAYVGTIISPPHLRKVQLKMDSFFPFKVFLNGRQVYYRPGLDADRPDKRVVDVDLLEGDNTLVFKISQTRVTSHSFPWGLYYRMVAEEKRPDVTDFPSKWAFHTDPDNVGTKQAWFAAEFADSAWQRIPVPSAWEKTAAGQYDGYAWYRVKFDVVPEVSGKKLALTFRGVDEQAWIYVNGTYVGERTSKSTGRTVGEYWEEAFELSLPPGCVRPGGDNVLAVRVHDWRYAGGIYGAVRLLLDE